MPKVDVVVVSATDELCARGPVPENGRYAKPARNVARVDDPLRRASTLSLKKSTEIMPRIKPTWCDEEMTGKTQLVQRNEMESTGIRMEVKQQTCWAHGEAVETEVVVKGNTDAGHEGDGEKTRHHWNTDAA